MLICHTLLIYLHPLPKQKMSKSYYYEHKANAHSLKES